MGCSMYSFVPQAAVIVIGPYLVIHAGEIYFSTQAPQKDTYTMSNFSFWFSRARESICSQMQGDEFHPGW